MTLEKISFKNNIQAPVQVAHNNVSNAVKMTVPTQIEPHIIGGNIPSAASEQTKKAAEAVMAQTLAQAPISYSFVRDLKLPFSNNAKLFKLANGQKVVVLEKKGPTVLQSYYNVGSMNEPDSQRGISHFNEHMAFNGSKSPIGRTLGAGDFFKTINEIGAMTNASTGFSQTDYFISSQLLGENVFEKSAFLQSQQLLYPEHSAEMVEKEKGPVTSEISMVADQPENVALNNCIRNLFQIQSTSPDLIAGTIDNINNLNRQKTLDYYNLWYTPDNCSTVVTGEIPTKEAMDTIARHFNKTSNVPVHQRKYQDFVGIQQPVRVDVKMPKAQNSTIALGFSGPANNSTKENIQMELLLTTLMGYKNARINKNLKQVPSSAFMNIERVGNRPTDPKAILIVSQSSHEKTEEVIKKIYDEINNISTNPITQQELETAKKTLKMAFSKASENSHLLNILLGSALLDDDLSYIENYLTILDSITPQDISVFAKKYLDLNKASLSVVHPENVDDATIMENYKKAADLDKKSPMASKVSFKGTINNKFFDISKVRQYKLANNMDVVLNTNNSDIVSSTVTISADAPADVKPSVPMLLSVMLNEGSKNKNNDEFYNQVSSVGMDLKFNAGFQAITAQFESLSQDANMGINLIKEVFNTPRFNEESFNYAKNVVKEAILNEEASASESALKTLMPNVPKFATREEVLKSLDNVTLADVIGLYNYIKQNAMAKAVITAPTSQNSQLEQNILQNLSVGLGQFNPYQRKIFSCYHPLEKDVLIKNTEQRNQADIVQAFKFATNHNPKDQVVFKLLNTILGESSSSRLFNDLREKQKLAYRVESQLDYKGNTGVIMLGIKTTTDDKIAGVKQFENVKKSLDGFKKHIEKLKKELVADAELEAARLRLKTKLLNSVESSGSQTNVLNASKDSVNGINELNEKLRLIDEVTAQDIQNAANYIFSTPSVTSILASEDTIKNCGL